MPADDSCLPSVDLTLVDAVLRMSPEERLEHNDRMATLAEELRAGLAATTEEHG
jgi:hypothetical protein